MTECSISYLVAHSNGQKRGHRQRREAGFRRKYDAKGEDKVVRWTLASKAKLCHHFCAVIANDKLFPLQPETK